MLKIFATNKLKNVLNWLIGCCLWLISLHAQAQYCNDLNYFIQPRFTEVSISTIPFSYVTNLNGNVDTLRMDIYQPNSDTTTQRPVIVWLHGGSVLNQQRGDIAALCRLFAKRGYVCAAIDYRQRPPLSRSEDTFRLSLLYGVHDCKAAIRTLRTLRGTYRLSDTNYLLGGRSEGAMVAMTAAMLDTTDAISSGYLQAIRQVGGLEGASDTLGVSAAVKGVFNLSGGIPDRRWIDGADPNIANVYIAKDSSLPHESGRFANLTSIDGVLSVNEYLRQVGKTATINMIFNEHPNVVYSESYLNFVLGSPLTTLTNFARRQICPIGNIIISNEIPPFSTNAANRTALNAYPNPSHDLITIDLPHIMEGNTTNITVYDMFGRPVNVANHWQSTQYTLRRSEIGVGVFVVKVQITNSEMGQPLTATCKVIFL